MAKIWSSLTPPFLATNPPPIPKICDSNYASKRMPGKRTPATAQPKKQKVMERLNVTGAYWHKCKTA